MQRLPSLQTTVVPTHAPKVHVSLLVHALPSLQPLLLFANTQPVAGSHESVVQALPSLQVCVVPDWHALLAQASPIVHTLPSLHAALLAEFTQPEDALQVSLVQALPSSQSIPAPGTQLPAAQASPTVHTLPSLQVLLLFSVWQPVAALHESVVHGLPSSQFWFTPGAQLLAAQMSPMVHALPSEQTLLFGVNAQPPTLLQLSVVHGLLSLHC